jgi:hypothetical protein
MATLLRMTRIRTFFTACMSTAFWSDPKKHRDARIMILFVIGYAITTQTETPTHIFLYDCYDDGPVLCVF